MVAQASADSRLGGVGVAAGQQTARILANTAAGFADDSAASRLIISAAARRACLGGN